MSEVTIIMPTLNVGSYIRECLQSVVDQTFQDIEILIIDAGSTDGTLDVLREYAEADSRIRVLHSDRKSYGYQINMGIQIASGQFVGVVETDDYIEKDMIETLYYEVCSGNYDYVKGTAKTFRDVAKDIVITTDITCTDRCGTVICPCEHPELFVKDRFLWLGLYRVDFVKNIRLNETPGAAYQDIGFIYQVLKKSSTALYLDKVVYHYRQDNQNASGYNHKAFRYLFDEFSVILKNEQEREWLKAVCRKLTEQSLSRFRNMALSGCFWEEYETEMQAIRAWVLEALDTGLLNREKLGTTNQTLLVQWQQGNRELYRYCLEWFEKQLRPLKDCLSQAGERRMVVFGAGRFGRLVHSLIENHYPGKVAAYCDNNRELWGKRQQGIQIYAPETAVKQFDGCVFVISISVGADDVNRQLNDLGVNVADIIRYRPEYDYLLFNADY